MSKYIPKLSKDENDLLILSDVFSVEECLKYAKEHNMRVLMECTTSTSSVEIMMLFQKMDIFINYSKKMYMLLMELNYLQRCCVYLRKVQYKKL